MSEEWKPQSYEGYYGLKGKAFNCNFHPGTMTGHLIDDIQDKRTENNRNWMDLVRLAFKTAPDEAKEIMRRINAKDAEISALAGRLAE